MDTDKYLVLKSSNVPPTGWQMTTKYWRAKKYPKSDLRGGQMTRGTDRYLVLKFYQVLPMDNHEYRRVPGSKLFSLRSAYG